MPWNGYAVAAAAAGRRKKIKEENTQPAGIREGEFPHTRTHAPTHPNTQGKVVYQPEGNRSNNFGAVIQL